MHTFPDHSENVLDLCEEDVMALGAYAGGRAA